MSSNKLGDYIKNIRGDMSLRDFAKLCGISHTHIDSIEKGVDPRTNKTVRPTVETLNKISLGTGISIKKLVDLSMDIVSDEIPLIQSKEAKCKDLIEFLKQPEVLFDGILLSEEDKAKVKASLEIVFWDAKQKKKREKS
ncbi:helix-turn-helix domain-containing protein [Pelosinus propionicus]|uniref:Helix-turn-helix n=1 Tax=Pelosinus propionicus DSM 13327 TaxID=1123291 RepID=A0A1I4HI62_9FIRM|nr:helix-turn-helix transcriptional regulator [Pelosinus propionicus]SFL41939.1 Helix-turn-helix [Pelosinus propionicus DSM 13327]